MSAGVAVIPPQTQRHLEFQRILTVEVKYAVRVRYPLKLVAGWALALVALNAADTALTLALLAEGGTELNPAGRAVLGAGPMVVWVLKLGLPVVAGAAVWVAGRGLWLLRALVAWYVFVVAWNSWHLGL